MPENHRSIHTILMHLINSSSNLRASDQNSDTNQWTHVFYIKQRDISTFGTHYLYRWTPERTVQSSGRVLPMRYIFHNPSIALRYK